MLGQSDGVFRRFLCLLLEPVEEDHLPAMLEEKDTGDPAGKRGSNLPQSIAEGIDERFSPLEGGLDGFDILADDSPLLLGQCFQPLPDRFISFASGKEPDGSGKVTHDMG
ncbi:MAG: hypothetical protein BGO12_01670 [Verrucomicrobia bacterium 61-8]|nr:MAG: hypothetical protein BGO12_01670 [Verrucomicrobia bacterium 61-8]